MSQLVVPYLCGGIFLTLLLEARKTRKTIRDRNNYGSDGLRDKDILIALVECFTGEPFPSVTDDVIKKETTNYKKCETNGATYIPFSTKPFITSLNSSINKKDPELLNRMSGFVDKYIGVTSKEWLVKALFDTILKDEGIPREMLFTVTKNNTVAKKELQNVTEVELPIFLLSVFHFIVNERKDNIKGKEAFLAWHKQTGPRTQWKFSSDIGDGITWNITVRTGTDNIKALASESSRKQSPDYLELPPVRPQENIPYSDEDKALLQEFTSDYEEIMQTLLREDYANALIDMSLPTQIQKLYSSKWKTKGDTFQDPALKSQVFGLLGELNKVASLSFSKPYLLRQSMTAIRRYFVMLHPDSFDSTMPFDIFIDDWNDGEY